MLQAKYNSLWPNTCERVFNDNACFLLRYIGFHANTN